jgi:hypothetical protein
VGRFDSIPLGKSRCLLVQNHNRVHVACTPWLVALNNGIGYRGSPALGDMEKENPVIPDRWGEQVFHSIKHGTSLFLR